MNIAGVISCDPPEGGTFVAHHMLFHTHLVKQLLHRMTVTTRSTLPWPLLIMSYSRLYYRFSEYKTYASYLQAHHPNVLLHHRLADFGEGGLRFRDARAMVRTMTLSSETMKAAVWQGGLSYPLVHSYMVRHWRDLCDGSSSRMPAYVQLDHVYGLPKKLLAEPAAQISIGRALVSVPTRDGGGFNSANRCGCEVLSAADVHGEAGNDVGAVGEVLLAAAGGASRDKSVDGDNSAPPVTHTVVVASD